MPRKVFVPNEILTAADVNTNLMDQAVMVFADSTARTAAIPTPVEGMVTYLEDVGGAQGLEVFDGAAFTPVAIEPDPPAILQVVSVEKTDTFVGSVASGATVEVTGMSASITPSSTSSKIIVAMTVSGAIGGVSGVESALSYAAIVKRGVTSIGIGDAASSRTRVSFGGAFQQGRMPATTLQLVDSPSTTSSVTYSLHVLNTMLNTTSFFLNRPDSNGANDADAARTPRSASRIILMEVAG